MHVQVGINDCESSKGTYALKVEEWKLSQVFLLEMLQEHKEQLMQRLCQTAIGLKCHYYMQVYYFVTV